MVLPWTLLFALAVTGGAVGGPIADDRSSESTCCGEGTFTGVYRRIEQPIQDIQISRVTPLKRSDSPIKAAVENIILAESLAPEYADRYHELRLPTHDSDYMNDIDALASLDSLSESRQNSAKRSSLGSLRPRKFGSLGRSLSIGNLGKSRSGSLSSRLFGSTSRNLNRNENENDAAVQTSARTLTPTDLSSTPSSSVVIDESEGDEPTLHRSLGSAMLGRNRNLIGSGLQGGLNRGRGLSLSIDASMQVLRQALLFRSALMKQRQQMSRARQNQEILQNIGKRSIPASESKRRM